MKLKTKEIFRYARRADKEVVAAKGHGRGHRALVTSVVMLGLARGQLLDGNETLDEINFIMEVVQYAIEANTPVTAVAQQGFPLTWGDKRNKSSRIKALKNPSKLSYFSRYKRRKQREFDKR